MKNINTETLHKYTLSIDCTLKSALEKLNKLSNELTLFVIDNQNKLVGTITDGDIRRVIILGSSLEENISIGLNRNCKKIYENNIDHHLFKKYAEEKIFLIPIVDEEQTLKGYLNLNVVKTILPLLYSELLALKRHKSTFFLIIGRDRLKAKSFFFP